MRYNRGLSGDPVLRALALAGLLVVPWFLFGPAGAFSSWLLQSCIDVFNLVLATRLYRLPWMERHGRRFWTAVAGGMGCSAIGDSYQTVLVALGHPAGQVSVVQTVFVDAGMVVVVVTMLF